eukprot:310662_1
MQILDINRNVWSSEIILLPFVVTNDNHSGWERQQCVLVDDSLYVIGGKIATNFKNGSDDEYIDGIYKYNTTISMWSYHGNVLSTTAARLRNMIQIFDIKQQHIIKTISMKGIVQNESASLIVDDTIMVLGGCWYKWDQDG